MIRSATEQDIDAVERTYRELLTDESEQGSSSNWALDVYPTKETAEKAMKERTLYVLTVGEEICASMILNQIQPEEYQKIPWHYLAGADQILVIHTLCVPPRQAGKGYGKQMVRFAMEKARELRCKAIRLDTWAENKPAAMLYQNMGFRYAGTARILLQGVISEEQIFFEMGFEDENENPAGDYGR